MPDLDSSLKHLEESGARASSSRVDGCWGFAFIAIGIALWMSGVSPQLGSILFVIGLVGLVIAWFKIER
jgi:hypothetical protein